ncbi:hypothetical protein KR054_007182, partial [Drosophila jambulina]
MAYVSFTNLKCESLDRKFTQFETCHIKAVNRTHKYIDIYAKLKVLPIQNVEVSLNIYYLKNRIYFECILQIKLEPMRYDNGYNPFLLAMTFDLCKYMRNPSARSMILLRDLHATFVNASNMNHTCPYNHDIIIDKLFTGNLEKSFTRYIPVPHGNYAIFSKWYVHKIQRSTVKIYFTIT